MPLPQAVAAQAKRAEALSAKLKAGQVITVDDIGPPINAPTNPEPPRQQVAPQPPAAPPQTPPAAPAIQPVAQPPAAPQPPANPVDWEHKFQVLQGKYNAEVPRLHEQLRNMQAQLNSTQSLLATLGQQQAQPPVTPAPPPVRLTKDEEVKEYGSDLYDFIRRTAAEAVLPQVGQMVDQRVGPVAQQLQTATSAVQNVQQQQALTAEQVFYNDMDRLVPSWESVNGTEAFGNWLAVQDPLSGQTRGAMLASAFQNGDAPRVAQFFIGFQKENAAATPPVEPQPPAGQPPATPAVRLEQLAAPGTGTGGPPAGAPEEAGKRTYTVGEIAAFYRDVQRGAYRGKDKDRVAIEKDIFLAQKQGRVRAR